MLYSIYIRCLLGRRIRKKNERVKGRRRNENKIRGRKRKRMEIRIRGN